MRRAGSGRPNRGSREGGRRTSEPRPARSPDPPSPVLLPPDWRSRRYLALDFETTGFSPEFCRVVEVGALVFVPGEGDIGAPGLESLESLVNPGIPIPAVVTAVHGIRDEDVADAPSFAELLPRLLGLVEGAVLVAHNAPFDVGFLAAEIARSGGSMPDLAVLDSLVLARQAFPGLPSYSLPRLAASLGIETGRSHRALDDARAAAKVFVAAARSLSGTTSGP